LKLLNLSEELASPDRKSTPSLSSLLVGLGSNHDRPESQGAS
jgi:hypothetical protein